MPVLLAVGQREVDEQTVAMRRLGGKHQKVMSLEDAIGQLADEVRRRGKAP